MRGFIEAVLSRHFLVLRTTRHGGGSRRSWGGWMAVIVLSVFLPVSLAHATDINVHFVTTGDPNDDVISSLNPPSTKFDIVYLAGFIKSEDLSTTFGSFLEIVPRYVGTAGTFNYFDGVAVLPGGNVYYKMVLNFADSSKRGVIVGGDGTFAGTTGSIERISGTLHRVSIP
jgi:hypothetical protein